MHVSLAHRAAQSVPCVLSVPLHLNFSPGDNVTALAGRLRARCDFHDCSCWPKVNASITRLRVPDVPLVPEALFLGASKVGSCSDLSLDITSSTGSGGRDWVRVDWVVNGTLPPHNLTKLREYASAWSAASPQAKLHVPNSFLSAGQSYTFIAILENFLGFESKSQPFEVLVAAGS